MNITAQYRIQIERAIRTGLQILRKAEPLRLSEWADQNFYLVAESSYIEGLWETLPHQRAIMDCISNDDIRSVTVRKSARVGYTKIIVAAVGYFAEHKRRNQVLFQPVDQDAEDFTKDEIDPMLRDVPAVQKVFPYFNTKSKFNTLTKKVFRGSTLDIRGGKAAKNYRRLSKDVVYYDELEGFDGDIEGEGDPVSLGDKRTEGATFPKSIRGSTPGLAETSLILRCERAANERFTWHAPCPHCDLMQQIVWGGRDSSCGLKWDAGDAKSVQYLCEGCACLFPFEAYLLESYPKGRYISESGMWIDDVGLFRSPSGEIVDTPEHVALSIWTGAAAQVPWHRIVADFFEAKKSPGTLKTFVNTTLGEAWGSPTTPGCSRFSRGAARRRSAATSTDSSRRRASCSAATRRYESSSARRRTWRSIPGDVRSPWSGRRRSRFFAPRTRRFARAARPRSRPQWPAAPWPWRIEPAASRMPRPGGW